MLYEKGTAETVPLEHSHNEASKTAALAAYGLAIASKGLKKYA